MTAEERKLFDDTREKMKNETLDGLPQDGYRKLLAYMINAESLLKEYFPEQSVLLMEHGLMRKDA